MGDCVDEVTVGCDVGSVDVIGFAVEWVVVGTVSHISGQSLLLNIIHFQK